MKTDINDTLSELWAQSATLYNRILYNRELHRNDKKILMALISDIRTEIRPHVDPWVSEDVRRLRTILDEYHTRN